MALKRRNRGQGLCGGGSLDKEFPGAQLAEEPEVAAGHVGNPSCERNLLLTFGVDEMRDDILRAVVESPTRELPADGRA